MLMMSCDMQCKMRFQVLYSNCTQRIEFLTQQYDNYRNVLRSEKVLLERNIWIAAF